MKVAVLNYEHAIMSSVAGPYDMWSQVNEIMQTFQPNIQVPEINVQIIDSKNIEYETVFDLLLIPAMNFTKISEVLENEKHLLKWISWQYEKKAEVASICLGAFLLASTGLLNKKSATTHWIGVELFQTMFPAVDLVDHKIITDFDRIYTSGGAYSFTTLMIYIIEKYFGHEAAILLSKVFLIHLHDTTQTSFNILNLQKSHNNKDIQKVQQYIEQNFSKNLKVDLLAEYAKMSLRTFIRNFKKSTGNTPYEYLQKVRMEKAKKMLEQNNLGVEQVSFEVGYTDFAAFRKIFKKNVGQTPSKYKKLYGKMFYPENIATNEMIVSVN